MIAEPVRKLATVVSLAARIEPELLRAARLRLLPEVDVSAEADLWFSALVAARSTRRVVLDAEIAASLRESLASDPALLNAARAVVVELHRNAPPAIQLEEEILYLALTGADVADAVNTKLTSVLNAIANEGRRGLIDWAARALPSMPDVVQNTTAAAALRLVAGGERATAMHVRRAVIDDPAIAALIEKALPRTKVFARLVPREDTLCVEIGRTELPAAHEIELPKTEPLVLELTTANQSEIVDVPREGTLVRTIVESVSIRTIAREVFRIEEAREEERATVRLLGLKRLRMSELGLPKEPDIDAVLIAGNVTRYGNDEEYERVADRLRDHYGTTPILTVPASNDKDRGFASFRARLGFTSGQIDFAKSLQIGKWRVGIVGIETSMLMLFRGSQIFNVCNGDPLAWASSHDVAILLMYEPASDFAPESKERWLAFGADGVFDLFLDESMAYADHRKDPEYVVIEIDPTAKIAESTIYSGVGQKITTRRTVIRARPSSPPSTSQPRRVLVAGISEKLSIPLQELCHAIGSLLALQGHDLLTGGWPGVDYLAAEGFENAAPNRVESISHYVGGERKISDYPRGRQIVSERDEEALARAVREADVVILVEGVSGTRAVGREALYQGKPVIPVGSGAAAELRADVLKTWPEEMHERLQRLGNRSSVAVTVHEVNELLRVAPAAVAKQEQAAPRRKALLMYGDDDNTRALANEFRSLATALVPDAFVSPERLTEEAIDAEANTAIVFVDDTYLISAGNSGELADLFTQARNGELTLYWFLASRSDYAATRITEFQAGHDISKPLDELAPPLRRAIFRSFAAQYLATEGDEATRTFAAINAALSEIDQEEFPLEWATLMRNLGVTHYQRGDLESAVAAYQNALGVFTRRDAPADYALATSSLAFTLWRMGRLEDATNAFEQVLEVFTELRNDRDAAVTLMNLGALHTARGATETAIASYEHAREILRAHALPDDEARVTYQLAYLYEQTGNMDAALAAFQIAAERFKTLGIEADLLREAVKKTEKLVDARQRAQSTIDRKRQRKEYDVFLAFHSADKAAVIQIATKLREHGILPWFDEWDPQPGVPWWDALEKSDTSIKSVAVFIGPSQKTPWPGTQIEALLQEFAKRQVPIIPVLLPGTIDPQLPLLLASLVSVDFNKTGNDPFAELVEGITRERPSPEKSPE
ncbi:MAG TPA: TIR domain-containing protein [Thermoanaerobaculia bacterium]|nr:TIR domain-containing protein [Thermoanaerobaculia bacterium]